MKLRKVFTLLETLLVVATIAILAGIVVLAINPSRQLALDRNIRRLGDVKALLNAVYQKTIDSTGSLMSGPNSDWQMIGTATSGCSVSCGVSQVVGPLSLDFSDSSQADFNNGSYYRSFYSGINSAIELDSAGLSSGSGIFTSAVKNNNNSNWTNISWQPGAPYGKPLPNNQQSETSYPSGNSNMSGNTLLLHAEELSGSTTFIDDSGLGNNGSCSGVCPQSGLGKINNGLVFNGTTSSIIIPTNPVLSPASNLTLEAWVKWAVNPSSASSWASIINKNSDNQYRLHHNTSNTKFEFAIAMHFLPSVTTPQNGVWYHLVGTFNGSVMRLYVNGVEESNLNYVASLPIYSTPVYIGRFANGGRYFNGAIDEVAIYNRTLSASEVLEHYNRGAKRLKLKIRACPDQSCSGANFVGPDSTVNSYYSDSGYYLGLPSSSITGLSGNYFQYQTIFETDSNTSPKLNSLTINSSGSGQAVQGYTTTTESCLNLEPALIPDYLSSMPYDPKVGSLEKTYYAIKKSQNNRISIMSCSPELEENILLSH